MGMTLDRAICSFSLVSLAVHAMGPVRDNLIIHNVERFRQFGDRRDTFSSLPAFNVRKG